MRGHDDSARPGGGDGGAMQRPLLGKRNKVGDRVVVEAGGH
jgi:hypothetical protein